jgi:hypothetical protein
MLRKPDERAATLNISRQAVIKTLLGQALSEDQVATIGSPKKPVLGEQAISAKTTLKRHTVPKSSRLDTRRS